ncbi:MAG: glycosyltransferase, partial [Proteobacteria bacterium]|nr:glycosyltransferase [Pseudomonadota bacterium]
FVAHIPLYWDRPSRSLKSLGKLLVLWIYGLRHRLRSVAVSEWKQSTWGLRGSIVRFFPIAFPSHLLAAQKARTIIPVIVGNGIRSRGLELGWDLLQTLVKEFPLRILGRNPDIPEATQPRDYAEFVQLFSESHFYVFTIRQPEGDGYNTAMLEAMRLGLPVVTIANPSSPIIHGFNGLVAQSLPELRQHIKTLMLSPSLIEKLGAAAQETVTSQFSEQSFLAAWREALHDS